MQVAQANSFEIFENTYDSQRDQFIYMNYPGSTQLDLQRYGIGPNISYEYSFINNLLNISLSVNKLNNWMSEVDGGVKGISQVYYIDDLLVLEFFSQKFIKYLRCTMSNGQTNCTEYSREAIEMPIKML